MSLVGPFAEVARLFRAKPGGALLEIERFIDAQRLDLAEHVLTVGASKGSTPRNYLVLNFLHGSVAAGFSHLLHSILRALVSERIVP